MSSEKVNAFEAKTHLSGLLRETERGRSFVILRRDKPVARLVPPGMGVKPHRNLSEIFREMTALRRRIGKRLKSTLNVRELIEEGRRF